MLCSACQATIAEGAKFCPKCGTRAVAPAAETGSKRCPQCGTENPANAKFCKKDGYRFESVAEKPDMAVVPAPAAQAPGEPSAPEIAPNKIPLAGDTVICPQCGTPNLPGAKFCKKDGYSLRVGVAAPQVTPDAKEPSSAAPSAKGPEPQPPAPTPDPQAVPIKQPVPATARSVDIGSESSASKIMPAAESVEKSRKGMMIGALVGVVLLAGAVGGYAYWAGHMGNRQGDVQAKINTELGSRGLSNVQVTIDREWGASLSGTVMNQAGKDQALELIRSHKELKNIVADQVQVQPGAADLEKNLNKALTDAGFNSITAQVDKEMVATLTGIAESPDQKVQALKVASGLTGVKDVKDDVQVPIAENAPPAPPPELAPPVAPPMPAAQASPPPPHQ